MASGSPVARAISLARARPSCSADDLDDPQGALHRLDERRTFAHAPPPRGVMDTMARGGRDV